VKWRASPTQLLEAFDGIFPGPPAVKRKMFGYPAAFVNGNMFMGLFQDRLILRLAEQPRKELLSVAGASPFEPVPGRPMREYVVAPSAMIGDRKTLSAWSEKALAYGASLPPKVSAVKSVEKRRAKAKPTKRCRE